MSVYTHPSKPGHQMIKISHGRKGKPDYIDFPGNREQALIYEKEIRGLADRSDPYFTDKLPAFKLAYKNEVSAGTYTDFEWALKQLEPFFQSMKLRNITPLIIEQYKTMRLQQPVKNTTRTVCKRTVNRELTYLSKYLAYCGSELKPTKFRKKDCKPKMPDTLTMQELQQIIDNLKPPFNHLVQLMAYNGLRKSEAFQIRSIQADKDGSRIRVLGKGGVWRIAPIELPDLQKAIAAEKKKRPDGYLFPNSKTNEPYTDIRKPLKKAAEEAGITKLVYNHLCRHSFATAMVGQGINLRIVQGLLGHADLKTVQIYTHLADETLRTGTASLVAKVATPKTRTTKGRTTKSRKLGV